MHRSILDARYAVQCKRLLKIPCQLIVHRVGPPFGKDGISEESAHTFVWKIDRKATIDAEGIKHEECSACGFTRNENTAIDKLPPDHEHDYGTAWKSDEQSHWKECSCGERSEESPHSFIWVTDIEPTQETEGSKHEECITCGATKAP